MTSEPLNSFPTNYATPPSLHAYSLITDCIKKICLVVFCLFNIVFSSIARIYRSFVSKDNLELRLPVLDPRIRVSPFENLHLDELDVVFDLSTEYDALLQSNLMEQPLDFTTERDRFLKDLPRMGSQTLKIGTQSLPTEEFYQKLESVVGTDLDLFTSALFCCEQDFLNGPIAYISRQVDEQNPKNQISQDCTGRMSRTLEVLNKHRFLLITQVITNYRFLKEDAVSSFFTVAIRAKIDKATKKISTQLFVTTHEEPTENDASSSLFKQFFCLIQFNPTLQIFR
ncbi:MAG: hypothetical protein ACOYK9_00830 [Chlamydiia bacterium]